MPIQFSQDVIENSTKPIIIMAFASWCPHCARMEPIYDDLAGQLDNIYTFSKFDIDKSPELTAQFKVQSLPTFIFIENKKEVNRAQGEMSRDDLEQLIEDSFTV